MLGVSKVGFVRRPRPFFGSVVLVAGILAWQGASPALAINAPQTFIFTGSAQTYTVPAGVCSVTVDAFGAAGGPKLFTDFSSAGLGGEATATLAVIPGETLQVNVGGAGKSASGTAGGAGGFNGGADGGTILTGSVSTGGSAGGGGASDVRRTPFTLADRLIVAGGGGGEANTGYGGAGGGLIGGDGGVGVGLGTSGGGGGGGGTQSAGGAGGTGGTQSPYPPGMPGAPGTSGSGGRGGDASSNAAPGAGGGGGYFGGGGGGGGANQSFGGAGGGGGGGGSGFGPAGVTFLNGVRPGDGLITITPGLACPKLATAATLTATLGASISDVATLSGGDTPTGAITFQLFGPNNLTCTAPALFTSTPTVVSGNGSYQSDAFTPLAVGTYLWVASYSGDANNKPAATACNDAGETSTITAAVCQEADGNGDIHSDKRKGRVDKNHERCDDNQGENVDSSDRAQGGDILNLPGGSIALN